MNPEEMEIIEDIDLSDCTLHNSNTCQSCKQGTMKEMSIYDDWEGILTCDKCGLRTKK